MIYQIANVAELSAAIAAAVGGDTLRLAAGNYGSYVIRGEAFTAPVRIESADPLNPAHFDGLQIRSSSNIVLAGLDLGRGLAAGQPDFTDINLILDSENITLSGVHVHGSLDDNPQNDGRGLRVVNTRGLLVEDSLFTELNRAVVVERGYNIVLRDSEWRTIRSDGIQVAASEGIVIQNSKFSDFRPVVPDHGDVIQFFNNGNTKGSKNILIENNEMLLTNYNGTEATGMQGIFISDSLGFAYENVLIRNNVLYSNGAYHGITIDTARHLQITDNTVLSKSGDAREFWIRVAASDGVIIDRNVADNIIMAGGVTKLFMGENVNFKLFPTLRDTIPNLNNPLSAADLMTPGLGYTGAPRANEAPVSTALATALSGSIDAKQVQQAFTPIAVVEDTAGTTLAQQLQVFAAPPAPVQIADAAPFGERFGAMSMHEYLRGDHFQFA